MIVHDLNRAHFTQPQLTKTLYNKKYNREGTENAYIKLDVGYHERGTPSWDPNRKGLSQCHEQVTTRRQANILLSIGYSYLFI